MLNAENYISTELCAEKLFPSRASVFYPSIEKAQTPWQALAGLHDFIIDLIESLKRDSFLFGEEFLQISEGVFAAKSATIAPSAYIAPPCVIFPRAEIRHCAYIRGDVIIGAGAVVGNSTEIKASVLFDGAAAPHFNYIGDSILGAKAHLGAGAVTSNLRLDGKEVKIKLPCGERIPTSRRKLGAILGDHVEVGCGSVLCPGTVLGRDSTVFPLVSVTGAHEKGSVIKNGGITK